MKRLAEEVMASTDTEVENTAKRRRLISLQRAVPSQHEALTNQLNALIGTREPAAEPLPTRNLSLEAPAISDTVCRKRELGFAQDTPRTSNDMFSKFSPIVWKAVWALFCKLHVFFP